jgi:hypothetical protein
VVEAMLGSEGSTFEVLFFAADTLYKKICFDFSGFPPER